MRVCVYVLSNLLAPLFAVGWNGDRQCPLQGFQDSRRTAPSCFEPRPEQHHQSGVHRWRWKSDWSQSLPTGMVITAGGAGERWCVLFI